MPEPRWSIVVPLYNKGPYVDQALASVREQTLADWELIVVDDGSLDDGAQRAAALCAGDARMRLVAQANAGVSAARNRGVREARGEWVAFLDADDLLHPDFLRELAALAEEFPEAELLGTGYARVADEAMARFGFGSETAAPARRRLDDLPATVIAKGMPFCASSAAVRRSTLLAQAVMFAPGEAMGEDLDLWFRLAERYPVALSSAVRAAYRQASQGSLSDAYRVGPMLPVWQRLEQRLRGGTLPARLIDSSRRFLHHVWVSWARRHLRAGSPRAAWPCLLRALRFGLGRRWLLTLLVACCPLPPLIRRLR